MKPFFSAIIMIALFACLSCEDKSSMGDRNKPPAVPSNSYPANYAVNVPVAFNFTWTCSDPDGDVLHYDIFVSTDSTFSFYIYQTYLSSPSQSISGLNYGTTYYWIVRAYDAEDTTYSPRWRFSTTAGSPALALSPTSLDFGINTTSMPFTIRNTGTSNMTWTISDNRDWITVSPTSGNTGSETDTITVAVSRSGLSSGTYTGTITVTPSGLSPQTVSVSMQIPTYLFTEGFESSIVPGEKWSANDWNSANGLDYWGDQSSSAGARVYSGNWSAYCADNSDISGQYYDNYMNSYMQIINGVNVAGYTNYSLSFKIWHYTETNYDYCSFQYWNGSSWVEPANGRMTGNSSGWVTKIFYFTGGTAFYFRWIFYSDGSNTNEGVYIDDIAVAPITSFMKTGEGNIVSDTGKSPERPVSASGRSKK